MPTANNKLKITAYKKNDFTGKVGEYVLKFNPSSIQHNYSVAYDRRQAFGSSGSDNKYKYSEPETISFELIFDDTIVTEQDTSYEVDKDIKEFKKLVFTYNGNIHRPNYLLLSWGEFIFKGQISKLNFSYTAFTPDGKALKAKANITFIQVVNTKTRLASESKSSPDLTHIYTIKEGDTLPNLSYKVYNDPNFYLELAELNNLSNFRNLKAGDKIFLPPLEK